MELLVKLLAAGGVMGILDYLWLGFIAKKLYYQQIGHLLLDKPNMGAALAFYVVYIIGVIIFVINPALQKDSLLYALGFGALFGLVAYATYDLTNLATMKNFSVKIVVIDLLWGMFITTSMAGAAYLAVKAL